MNEAVAKQYKNFKSAVAGTAQPVILLAGRRKVPANLQEKLVKLGTFLAKEFPQATFRSGNADGSDFLFASGVNAVDPSRMQLILPTAGHHKSNRHPENPVVSLKTVSAVYEEELAKHAGAVDSQSERIIEKR